VNTRHKNTVFPQLEQMLMDAAARRQDEPASGSGRRRRAIRRRALVASAVVLIGAPAMAATRPWTPLLGGDDRGHPTPTNAPVGQEALRSLEVLRRTQTDTDRARSRIALRSIGAQNHGVRLPFVRLLAASSSGAVVLVPVASFGEPGEAGQDLENGFCIYYPASTNGETEHFAGYPCWTLDQILQGKGIGRTRTDGRQHVYGLVPDGVVRVRVVMSDRTAAEAAVRDNFFDASLPAASAVLGDISEDT